MKIALLGYGVETESAYNYYKNLYPSAEFVSYDDKPEPKNTLPPDVAFVGDYHDFHGVDADIVIRTPAIAPSRVSSRGVITSVTKEFFAHCPAPIIGVTGTKGKGTTCSLITEILKADGKKVWLVGNIGAPALDVLDKIQPEDIVVFELSSFQLWDLDKSPHIAVVLMVDSEHLDVHADISDYIDAKSNITRHQAKDDIVIYQSSVSGASKQIAQLSRGKKIPYLYQTGSYAADGYFWVKDTRICPISTLHLPGGHNIENACAAIMAAWQFTQDNEAIEKGLSTFKGLPHRLKFVRELNGVSYYDDSIATTPGSAIAALKTFSSPKILILGGSSKQADFNELADEIQRANMRKVLLIGLEASHLEIELKKVGYMNYEKLGKIGMPEIVKKAHDAAKEGDIVILSPACASLDMFKNYSDRGEQFISSVNQL